jgi:hypothetical protein
MCVVDNGSLSFPSRIKAGLRISHLSLTHSRLDFEGLPAASACIQLKKTKGMKVKRRIPRSALSTVAGSRQNISLEGRVQYIYMLMLRVVHLRPTSLESGESQTHHFRMDKYGDGSLSEYSAYSIRD